MFSVTETERQNNLTPSPIPGPIWSGPSASRNRRRYTAKQINKPHPDTGLRTPDSGLSFVALSRYSLSPGGQLIMKRREFLSSTLAMAAATLALPAQAGPRATHAADGLVEVLLDEPIGDIAPELHGHFTEHIGGVVYDGIWVGENSQIPNLGGIRKALVDHLRQLRAPVIRWPGGCFADSYNWRDGIGPRAQRPVRTNFWDNTTQLCNAPPGPQKYDPNTFGTAEFLRFCQLAGAKPYLAANVRSLTPRDFDEWVEYCNSPAGSTTLAQTRAADGSPAPYNVLYWGIGNESWGCGGNFRPEEYAIEFRRFTSWVPNYGLKLRFIGSGPGTGERDPQLSWTRGFLENLVGKNPSLLNRLYGFALHYYCGTAGQGNSLEYSVEDWYEMLRKADVMESLITQHWSAMGEFDKARQVKLVVDEWGAWHRGPVIDPRYVFTYVPSIRDALVTGITLDIFNRHTEKLAMCNVAQLINCLHSPFLAIEDRFTATTIFHVFDMYKAHQGGRSVRLVCDAPSISWGAGVATAGRQSASPEGAASEGEEKSLWGLAGSASLQGKTLVITVVNPHASEPRTTELSLHGGSAMSTQVTVLTAPDIHAHNDFDHPEAVVPKTEPASVAGSRFVWTFKPASVTKLAIELE
jgi:alpha-N-arabinofuranosidase